jgi:hypothetical protein
MRIWDCGIEVAPPHQLNSSASESMSMNLQTLLPLLMPRAIAWAEAVAADVAARGEALTSSALGDAVAVGVRLPDKIRVLTIEQLPLPEDLELRAAAIQTGLLGPNMIGLTLGYSMLICRGNMKRSVLSHECRHVAQYESAGGIASFLPVYLAAIVQPGVGYWNSPFEQEARAYELRD